MKMPASCITLVLSQVNLGDLIRSLHHGGRAPSALLWGEEKLTLDTFLSFTDYFEGFLGGYFLFIYFIFYYFILFSGI